MRHSEKRAKTAFCAMLEILGFTDVRIAAAPADIVATKKGEVFYFELKYSSKKAPEIYFGSVTLREWRDAFRLENYFFVIASYSDCWRFEIIEPETLRRVSYFAPTPLAYFQLKLGKAHDSRRNVRSAIAVRRRIVEEIYSAYSKILRRKLGPE